MRQHTPLRDEDVAFFPLHILIDDCHADLLKLGFRHYLNHKPAMCAGAEAVVLEVLDSWRGATRCTTTCAGISRTASAAACPTTSRPRPPRTRATALSTPKRLMVIATEAKART